MLNFSSLEKILHRSLSCLNFSSHRGDVKSALEIFGQAKEEGPFVSQGSALRLLNTMAKTGHTEKFDSGMLAIQR